MAIAIPITPPPTDIEPDARHYTRWELKPSPGLSGFTELNPQPEDGGTTPTP